MEQRTSKKGTRRRVLHGRQAALSFSARFAATEHGSAAIAQRMAKIQVSGEVMNAEQPLPRDARPDEGLDDKSKFRR